MHGITTEALPNPIKCVSKNIRNPRTTHRKKIFIHEKRHWQCKRQPQPEKFNSSVAEQQFRNKSENL